MRRPHVWTYYAQEWFRIIVKELMRVVTLLFGHQLGSVKSIDFPNNGKDALFEGYFHPIRSISSNNEFAI
jgi:hypothetical protein